MKSPTAKTPIMSPCGELVQTARLYHVEVNVLSVDVPVTVLVLVTGYVEVNVLSVDVCVLVFVIVT